MPDAEQTPTTKMRCLMRKYNLLGWYAAAIGTLNTIYLVVTH